MSRPATVGISELTNFLCLRCCFSGNCGFPTSSCNMGKIELNEIHTLCTLRAFCIFRESALNFHLTFSPLTFSLSHLSPLTSLLLLPVLLRQAGSLAHDVVAVFLAGNQFAFAFITKQIVGFDEFFNVNRNHFLPTSLLIADHFEHIF